MYFYTICIYNVQEMASADLSASPVPEAEGGSSGEFVLKKLFAEFVVVSERKLQQVCSQSLVGLLQSSSSQVVFLFSSGVGVPTGQGPGERRGCRVRPGNPVTLYYTSQL